MNVLLFSTKTRCLSTLVALLAMLALGPADLRATQLTFIPDSGPAAGDLFLSDPFQNVSLMTGSYFFDGVTSFDLTGGPWYGASGGGLTTDFSVYGYWNVIVDSTGYLNGAWDQSWDVQPWPFGGPSLRSGHGQWVVVGVPDGGGNTACLIGTSMTLAAAWRRRHAFLTSV